MFYSLDSIYFLPGGGGHISQLPGFRKPGTGVCPVLQFVLLNGTAAGLVYTGSPCSHLSHWNPLSFLFLLDSEATHLHGGLYTGRK